MTTCDHRKLTTRGKIGVRHQFPTNFQTGLSAYDEIQKVPVELRGINIRRALEIAIHHKVYAYDAYFLECALATRCPLFTLDVAMKALAAKLGIAIWEEKA